MAEDAITRNETTRNRIEPAWDNLISANAWKGRAPTQAALELETGPPASSRQ